MAMEALATNIALLENPKRLAPRAYDVVDGGPFPPEPTTKLMSFLVGTDREAADVLEDWEPDLPERFQSIPLTRAQRAHLQRRRLLLRNRRIVSGYEILDRRLRTKLAGAGPETDVPPTWLTVGKWTARTIGDLIEGDIPLPARRRTARLLVRWLLRRVAQRRTIPMGRVLVLGNREIFAQVASVLTIFLATEFPTPGLNFTEFVEKYGDKLIGLNDPDRPDELLISITAATRDPLSDSMLRTMHAYYRAIGADAVGRGKWVQAGNLHLAAYEQRVAQTFVDVGLTVRPGRVLGRLLAGLSPSQRSDTLKLGQRPLDMLEEGGLLTRLVELVVAAFATRYILAIGVGRPAGHREPPLVFAPAEPLDLLAPRMAAYARAISKDKDKGTEAAQALRRIWVALDRADGVPDRCRVRDWRTYSARVSYIANLFAVSATRAEFGEAVFDDEELRSYLEGRLPRGDEVKLTDDQYRAVQDLLSTPHEEPHGLLAAAE
jgi:hypothetical protein